MSKSKARAKIGNIVKNFASGNCDARVNVLVSFYSNLTIDGHRLKGGEEPVLRSWPIELKIGNQFH
jgi:hypothetical protein